MYSMVKEANSEDFFGESFLPCVSNRGGEEAKPSKGTLERIA